MFETYRDRVQFYMVYIREAHPTDGWQVRANEFEDILIAQPTTLGERTQVAKKMCSVLKIKLPPLVDGMDDKVNRAYGASPDRLYLIDVNGRVAYQGDRGPAGFRPNELEAAIKRLVSSDS